MKKISELINIHKFLFLSFFAIFFLIYFLYYHTSSFDFIYLDDGSLIANKTDRMDSLSKIKNFILEPVFDENASKFYRPVLNLSFLIDTVICGGESGFYHFSNVLMHIAAVFLLLLLLRELKCHDMFALAACLLFAAHPALTSAVAWIPGRNDLLLAIFTFPAMIFFIRSLKTKKTRDFLLSAVFFILALLTKETAVVIPVIFASYVFFYDKIKQLDKKSAAGIAAAVAVPILIYIVFRFITLSQSSSELNALGMITRAINSSAVNIWYFGIIFLTEKIVLFPQMDLHAENLIRGFIPLLLLSGACVVFKKNINFKHIFFGLVWFALFMLPTYAMAANIYYTHRLYMPAAGIIIILLEIISAVYKTYPKTKTAMFAGFAIILIFMSVTAYKQSLYYEDRKSFWFKAYEEKPSSSRVNLGMSKYYFDINDYDKSEEFAFNAVNNARSRNASILTSQLGLIYFKKNELDKAEEFYKKALAASKYYEHSYTGLSSVYESKGDMGKAVAIINEGLSIMPNSIILKKYKSDLLENNKTNQQIIIMKYNKK